MGSNRDEGPYICNPPNNIVEYPEGFEICVLETVSSLNLRDHQNLERETEGQG
jgi:hypothetical protein